MEDHLFRALENLFGRIDGPMSFRLLVQPFVAMILATRDGFSDARRGDTPYGWALLAHHHSRGTRLREGWHSIRQVFFAALAIDVVYQLIQLRWIYIGEALVTAQALAIIPYLLLRGPANRLASLFLPRTKRGTDRAS